MTAPESTTSSDHPDQPHHMTEQNARERPTTPEVPPVPGADVDSDELQPGADRQPGAPEKKSDVGDANAERQPKDEVTSPELEHLDETIEHAKQAADEALGPHRD